MPMSTLITSPPSAWEKPKQFSIPLPFDYDPMKVDLGLACSSTHLILSHSGQIYIYSLPTFNLVHVLGREELSNPVSLEIHGEILVVKCRSNGKEGSNFNRACALYFWDLRAGEHLGTLELPDIWVYVKVSSPKIELVEMEENGKLAREEWPKNTTLIVCSAQGQFLRAYTLHRSSTGSTGDDVDEGVQENSTMLPTMTISLSHSAGCHASIGRTAVTGGFDASVRVWDIITGECRLVLIGHYSGGVECILPVILFKTDPCLVNDVRLDTTRIYSSSYDNTARIWDRQSGDCLHVLNLAPFHSVRDSFVGITPSNLIIDTQIPGQDHAILIWDHTSGSLVHQITGVYSDKGSWFGPLRSKESTLVTWGANEESNTNSFKIWDLRSGQILFSALVEPHFSYVSGGSQGRFLIAEVKQDEEYLLKVWDFGPVMHVQGTMTVFLSRPKIRLVTTPKRRRSYRQATSSPKKHLKVIDY
ncbi:hypothetical protein CVT26_001456 [Gymnopilus dilepis]|uniref:Uncharacterized protein n=1 Tax=Gymnopilus dilepis TaxID=231916 RepID=A0A409WB98_9AGAR|nr:hypothetical protein CVT26_001456 [Gymnopilus dilepis]